MGTCLVTGAAGFIGSHVAGHLHRAGHRVVAVDDLSGGWNNHPECSRFVKADVADHRVMARLFAQEGPTHVFHLAAYAAEGLSHYIRRFNYRNNILGSVTLVNEAVRHEVERFVFTSSMAVYGSSPPPMHEGMTPAPVDPYGIAKFAAEMDIRAAHDVFGLDYTIFRPHNVYGEGQQYGDRYRNVIGIFMNQLMLGMPLTVFGDGRQTRAFSYIDDVAPIIARSIEEPGSSAQTLNVGADQPITLNELAHEVASAFGVEAVIEHLPPRHEVTDAHASHERLRQVFGEQELTPLNVGLARMAAWCSLNGPRQPASFDDIEIRRGLPPSWASAGS